MFKIVNSKKKIRFEKSIELHRIAMDESSPDDELLSELAHCLLTRHYAYGHSKDLHEAIIHIERALELRPDSIIYRERRAAIYRFRFGITNDIGDLDVAISETRKCLDSNTLQGLAQAVMVGQLASILREVFEITRLVEYLDEAIEMVRISIDELRQGIAAGSNSDHSGVFNIYGDLLYRKFDVTGNINYLHESRRQYEIDLQLVPYYSILNSNIGDMDMKNIG